MQRKYTDEERVLRMRASREKYRQKNKARINARRRKKRLNRRIARLSRLESRCLNCDILLAARSRMWLLPDSKHASKYCEECRHFHKDEVRRHKWRRYYYRKKALSEERAKALKLPREEVVSA